MAFIRPFRALRPLESEVEDIASPPYDVLDREEARELIRDNPVNFLHVVKAEADLPDNVGLYDSRVYQKSKENFEYLKKNGHLVKDESPSFYFYRQKAKNHGQIGLVCLASVDEYDRGRIKKHENTRKAKEEDRTRHIETLNAQTGPVFLAYRDDKEMKDLTDLYKDATERESLYDFTDEYEVRHTVWKVDSDELKKDIQNLMGRADFLYIADGHHRSKAASLVREKKKSENPEHTGNEEYNYFLTVIFPHSELNILAYNRVVKDIQGQSIEEFMNAVEKNFEIKPVDGRYKPEDKKHFGMYVDKQWYHLKAKENSFPGDDAVKSLDASILQENLLHPVLKIKEPKKSDRIDFVGGVKGLEGLEKMVDSGKFRIAFALFPTSMEELMNVADAGLNMPPKSTWFEPKLKSGLFVNELD